MVSKRAGLVTWQDAEDALLEAWLMDQRLPDNEQRFLSAGSRSSMPEVIREADKCEHSPERAARRGLTRREMAFLDRLIGYGGASVINRALFDRQGNERSRGAYRLIGQVLRAKADLHGVGWDWQHIAIQDKAWRRRYNEQLLTDQPDARPLQIERGKEAVAKQYREAVWRVAVVLDHDAKRNAAGLAA